MNRSVLYKTGIFSTLFNFLKTQIENGIKLGVRCFRGALSDHWAVKSSNNDHDEKIELTGQEKSDHKNRKKVLQQASAQNDLTVFRG